MNTSIIINVDNYATIELIQKILGFVSFYPVIIKKLETMQYYVTELLEHNCSILTIMIGLNEIVTKIIVKSDDVDNLN